VELTWPKKVIEHGLRGCTTISGLKKKATENLFGVCQDLSR